MADIFCTVEKIGRSQNSSYSYRAVHGRPLPCVNCAYLRWILALGIGPPPHIATFQSPLSEMGGTEKSDFLIDVFVCHHRSTFRYCTQDLIAPRVARIMTFAVDDEVRATHKFLVVHGV